MGSLFYGDNERPIEVPNVLLAHVKAVVITKFRRGESFMFSWHHPSGEPGYSSAIWLQPAMPLRFEFGDPEAETLDRATLRELARAANSPAGLKVDLAA